MEVRWTIGQYPGTSHATVGAKDHSGKASGEAEREDESSGSENGEHHCRRHLRKIDMIDGIAVLEVKKMAALDLT